MVAGSAAAAIFHSKKEKILKDLESPIPDLSPKGSLDIQIAPLVHELNLRPGVVTTSSCSGRVSVFLEGDKCDRKTSFDRPPRARFGGKGGGGRWLFVSHEPFGNDILEENNILQPWPLVSGTKPSLLKTLFNNLPTGYYSGEVITALSPPANSQYIHLKFEPMVVATGRNRLILHILTENLQIANWLLSCAISSSFRESGIVNPLKNPIVAVRTSSLSLDVPVAIYDSSIDQVFTFLEVHGLLALAKNINERFEENYRRINLFKQNLAKADQDKNIQPRIEEKSERAIRKRREGLLRASQLRLGISQPDGEHINI